MDYEFWNYYNANSLVPQIEKLTKYNKDLEKCDEELTNNHEESFKALPGNCKDAPDAAGKITE